MQDWKQAYQLAINELQTSKLRYLGSVILYLLISLFILIVDGKGSTVGGIIKDIFLIIIFCLAPYYMKPKEFQMQKINGDLWAVPSVILLKQLPIKEKVLIRSRLIAYSFYSLPPQIILLVVLYVSSPNYREMMTPTAYVALSIIWLAIGTSIGFSMAASDIGGLINLKSMSLAIVYIYAGIAVLYFIFYRLLDDSIAKWTISIAQEWPFLSIIISIILTILSIKYYLNYMRKQIKKLDYL